MLVLLMVSSSEYGESSQCADFPGEVPYFTCFLESLVLCYHWLRIADDTFYIGYTKFVIVSLPVSLLYFDREWEMILGDVNFLLRKAEGKGSFGGDQHSILAFPVVASQ